MEAELSEISEVIRALVDEYLIQLISKKESRKMARKKMRKEKAGGKKREATADELEDEGCE